MASKSIPLVAYCPLAQGRAASNETLIAIGKKHNASARPGGAEMAARPGRRCGDPEGVAAESQQANLDALNVKLDDADRKAIAALPKDQRFVNPGFSPVWD